MRCSNVVKGEEGFFKLHSSSIRGFFDIHKVGNIHIFMLLKYANRGEIDIRGIIFDSVSLHKYKFVFEFIWLVTVCHLFIYYKLYRNANYANFMNFKKTDWPQRPKFPNFMRFFLSYPFSEGQRPPPPLLHYGESWVYCCILWLNCVAGLGIGFQTRLLHYTVQNMCTLYRL